MILNMNAVGPESYRLYRVGTDRNKWTPLVDGILDKTLDWVFWESCGREDTFGLIAEHV